MRKPIVLSMVVVCALAVVGCKKKEPTPATDALAPASASASDVPPAVAAAAPASASGEAFDLARIVVSEHDLGAWPHLALPAGYVFRAAETLPTRTKDLARVPIWTGNHLLWVEGRTFEDGLRAGHDKTYSRFELLKGIDGALTALGAVKLSDRSLDEATFNAERKPLEAFRSEFVEMQPAYWYDVDTSTYVLRTRDAVLWFVVHSNTSQGSLMVVQSPLPAVLMAP